jgi:hypothetical protein
VKESRGGLKKMSLKINSDVVVLDEVDQLKSGTKKLMLNACGFGFPLALRHLPFALRHLPFAMSQDCFERLRELLENESRFGFARAWSHSRLERVRLGFSGR